MRGTQSPRYSLLASRYSLLASRYSLLASRFSLLATRYSLLATRYSLLAMRILHLIPYMHPSAGGPPVVVDRWCVELRRLGIDAEVLTTNAYAEAGDTAWQEHYRSGYPITVLPCRGWRGFGYSPKTERLLRMKLNSCDLVHVHNVWSYCNRLAARLCPIADVPFIVSPHGMLDPHSMSLKSWKKRLYGGVIEFPALRKATGLMFTHPEEERLARQTCGKLPAGYVVPLGTAAPPVESREHLTQLFLMRFPFLQDAERIVFLGRLHSKKGLDLLLPAFARVAEVRGAARLILVGPGDETYVNELRRVTQSLGIKDRVVFAGPLGGRDKWAALAAADVYVLPSYQENFAIALVEALRIGTPVVCSRRINIWSDLAGAQAATICDLTVDDIASKVGGLLNDRASAAAQGQRGAVFAAANYTWEKSVGQLARVYGQILCCPSSVGGAKTDE
jgi:glycosyltransferase involved in cell wall biosynthesis